jgi:hypothetical protein
MLKCIKGELMKFISITFLVLSLSVISTSSFARKGKVRSVGGQLYCDLDRDGVKEDGEPWIQNGSMEEGEKCKKSGGIVAPHEPFAETEEEKLYSE